MLTERITTFVAANKFTRSITGWGSWFVSSWLFDDCLYPLVIAWLGPLQGGLIMATIAIAIAFIWLKMIVASDTDWFSMDTMHRIQRIVFWIVRAAGHMPLVRKSWIDKVETSLTFLAINIVFDPMITTLYFRRNDHSNRLTKKDIRIFLGSGFVSNLYWTLRNWGLVYLVKTGWMYVFR